MSTSGDEAVRRFRALVESGDVTALPGLLGELVRRGDRDAVAALGDALLADARIEPLRLWLRANERLELTVLVVHEVLDLPPVPDAWRVDLAAAISGVERATAVARVEAMRERGWLERIEAWREPTDTPERGEGFIEGAPAALCFAWTRVASALLREAIVAEREAVLDALLAAVLEHPRATGPCLPEVVAARHSMRPLRDPLHPFVHRKGTFGFRTNWMLARALELALERPASLDGALVEHVARLMAHGADAQRTINAVLTPAFARLPARLRRVLLAHGFGSAHCDAIRALVARLDAPDPAARAEAHEALHLACVEAASLSSCASLFEVLGECLPGIAPSLQVAVLERAVAMPASELSIWSLLLRAPRGLEPALRERISARVAARRAAVLAGALDDAFCDALSEWLGARLRTQGEAALDDEDLAMATCWAEHSSEAVRVCAAALWVGQGDANPWPRLDAVWQRVAHETSSAIVRARRGGLRSARAWFDEIGA